MQTPCIQCPDGKSAAATGQAHVSACGARCYRGFYKSASHPSTCSKCQIGRYMASMAHTGTPCSECKKGGAGYEYMAAAGTGAEELGQCNVPPCPAGRYSDSKTKNCETCPVGQYQGGDKMQTSCNS